MLSATSELGMDSDMTRSCSMVLLSLVWLACDGVAGAGYRADPYLTIQGSIFVGHGNPDDGELIIAWRADDQILSQRGVVRFDFPSRFELDIVELPPPEALIDNGDGTRGAEGTLIFYRDNNGNGQLDLTSADADDFVDSLVGYATEGALRYREAVDGSELEDGGFTTEGTEIELSVYAVDELSCFLLEPPPFFSPLPPLVGPFPKPTPPCPGNRAPEGAYVACSAFDTSSYRADIMARPASAVLSRLCGQTVRSCTVQLDGQPSPPEWPCI